MISTFNQPNKKINFKKLLGYGGRHLILRAAQQKGIDGQLLFRRKRNKKRVVYIRLKKGKEYRWISPSRGYFNSKFSCELALYKHLTYQILKSINLPIPRFIKINQLKQLNQIEIPPPWVIKPIAQAEGKDVLVGFKNMEELKEVCSQLFKKYSSLIIEEFTPGQDFRLLMLENKLLGAVKRKPPLIKGDGQHTIRQLIDMSNKKERSHQPQAFKPFLKPLKIDLEMERCLAQQNLNLETIPQKDRIIQVRQNANFSTGGEIEDVTEQVHPANIKIAQQALQALGLKLGGVDMVTHNISQSMAKTGGKIIEINGIPSLWIHHFPHSGQGREVAGEIIKYLFTKTSL